MKLLIVTQKIDVNDPILGFFVRWVEEFAKHCENITVICLEEGKHNFHSVKNVASSSENSKELSGTEVKILSLGKEDGVSKVTYLLRFYKYIYQERKNYDSVFVHMNQIYIILGGLFWRVTGKKISLWYTHKSVNFKLRIAVMLVNNVFTASPESFRLSSKKLKVTGHGIDIDNFSCELRSENNLFRLITIGRLSLSKRCKDMVDTVLLLKKRGVKATLTIVGSASTQSDLEYEKDLKNYILEKKLNDEIYLVGSIPHKNIEKYLNNSDCFLNMSETGSLDKAVLEAMASCIPVITSNEGLLSTLKNEEKALLVYPHDTTVFADKIQNLAKLSHSERLLIGKRLREIVESKHSLSSLIHKLNMLMSV